MTDKNMNVNPTATMVMILAIILSGIAIAMSGMAILKEEKETNQENIYPTEYNNNTEYIYINKTEYINNTIIKKIIDDTTPPGKVTNVSVKIGNWDNLYIKWKEAKDNIVVSKYRIFINNSLYDLASPGGGYSIVISDAQNNTLWIAHDGFKYTTGETYAIQISAIDGAGNEGGKSNPVTITA